MIWYNVWRWALSQLEQYDIHCHCQLLDIWSTGDSLFMFHWLPSNWVGPGVLHMTAIESCHVAVTGLPVCIQFSGSSLSSNWWGGGMNIIAAITGRLYHQWEYSFLFPLLPIFYLFFFVLDIFIFSKNMDIMFLNLSSLPYFQLLLSDLTNCVLLFLYVKLILILISTFMLMCVCGAENMTQLLEL